MSQLTLPAIGESSKQRNGPQYDNGTPLLENSPYGEVVGRKWPSKKERRKGKLTKNQIAKVRCICCAVCCVFCVVNHTPRFAPRSEA